MFNDFINILNSNDFLATKKNLLLAVSGGVDSMVLCHLMQRTDFQIGVAHVDHNTRQGESKKDADFVKECCSTYNIPFHLASFQHDPTTSANFQKSAREFRYHFFQSLGYDLILTAHHKDDNIETVLYNFLSGRSINLIPERVNNIYRPLISFSKNQILAYAKENNIDYREDLSNQSSDYDRNHIRNKIIPIIKSQFPNAEGKILGLAQRMSEDQKTLKKIATDLIQPFVKNKRIEISKETTRNYPQLLRYTILDYGFNPSQSDNIISSIETVGARFLSHTHELIIDRDLLIIEPLVVQAEPKEVIVEMDNLPVTVGYGRYNLKFKLVQHLGIEDKNNVYVSKSSIVEKLIISTWQFGDEFYPFGMNGKKQSLKKYFTNMKMDRLTKQRIPIIRHKDQIVWICGYRMDERYSRNTEKGPYLHISLSLK